MREFIEVDLRKEENSSFFVLEDGNYKFFVDDVDILLNLNGLIKQANEIEKTDKEDFSSDLLDKEIRKLHKAIQNGYIPVYFTSKSNNVPFYYESNLGKKYMFILPDYPSSLRMKRMLRGSLSV